MTMLSLILRPSPRLRLLFSRTSPPSPWTSSCRQASSASSSDDPLPNVNVCTLGATEAGKTLLSSALTLHASNNGKGDFKTREQIDGPKQSFTVRPTHLEWRTQTRRFAHSDLPGDRQYQKNLLSHIAFMDAALLVVNTGQGVLRETFEHYQVLRHMSPSASVVTFINSGESEADVKEGADLVKMELEEFLTAEEMERVCCGSAVRALAKEDSAMESLSNLVQEFDRISIPERRPDDHLFWSLENVGNIPNRGMFVAGRLQSGSFRVGTPIQFFLEGQIFKATPRDLEIFRRRVTTLGSGDRGGAFAKVKSDPDVKKGAVVFTGEGKEIAANWKIHLKSLPTSSTTKALPLYSGNFPFFHNNWTEGNPELTIHSSKDDPIESDGVLNLKKPIMASEGEPFVVRGRDSLWLGTLLQKSSSPRTNA